MTEYRPLFLTEDDDQAKAPPPAPPWVNEARDRWYSVLGIVALGMAPLLIVIIVLWPP